MSIFDYRKLSISLVCQKEKKSNVYKNDKWISTTKLNDVVFPCFVYNISLKPSPLPDMTVIYG